MDIRRYDIPAVSAVPESRPHFADEAPAQTKIDPARRGVLSRAGSLVFSYLPLLLFFLVWEFISRTFPSLQVQLPAPTEVLKGGYELVRQGTLQSDILASLKRVGVALCFASMIGYPLGIALGASKSFAWFFDPIVGF